MSEKSRARLGRGLSSLMGVANRLSDPTEHIENAHSSTDPDSVAPSTNSQTAIIPVAQITPNPHQPRRDFDEVQLSQLADSLKSSGMIQPVIVRQVGAGYELIAGERRLRAARLAGLEAVPAIIRDADSIEQAQLALIENVQRADLNPMERATAYQTLMKRLGLTQVELSIRLGEERSSVANYLRLLDLGQHSQQLVREGKLSFGHGKILAGVDDLLVQQKWADTVVAQELSVRSLERMIEAPITENQSTPTRPILSSDAYISGLEKGIAQQLGFRVQIRRSGKGKGRMVIHYASLDQFDELLNKLGVKLE